MGSKSKRNGLGALVIAVAATASCNAVLGLDDFHRCPQDGPCATGGAGGTSSSSNSGTGGAPPAPTCTDGSKNGSETGVDCGGATCGPCPDGQGCMVGPDCQSLVCQGGTCLAPKCDDQVKNGDESDADCGGATCPKCAEGAACGGASDCASGMCSGGKCEPAMCGDGVKNGSETAVDCGGGACAGCAPGLACNVAEDCESAICKAGSCVDYRVWGRQFGDAQDQSGNRVAVDAAGNVLVQGSFLGTVDLGGGALTNTYVPDPMDPSDTWIPDYFVAKLKSDGSYGWAKHFVSAYPGGGYVQFALAVDASNSVVLVAPGGGTFNFGGASMPNPHTCPPACDTYGTGIAKLDANANHQWSKRFDASATAGSNDGVYGFDVAATTSGIAVTGMFSDSVSFGGNAPTLTASGNDIFVVGLDGSGTAQWSKRFGNTSALTHCGRSIALDAANNVVIAGYFQGSMSFGGPTLTSAGGFDVFLARLGPSGVHVWSKRFGDVQGQASSCMAKPNDLTVTVDPSGNTILAGRLKGSLDFGAGPLTGSDGDAFIAKFDISGNHVWSKAFAGVVLGRPATDGTNAVLLTGQSTGAVDFGGGPLAGSGGFVAKLAADGSHVWSRRITGVSGSSIAASSTGHLLLTGALSTTEDFGGTPLTTAGGTDAFVAKIVNP